MKKTLTTFAIALLAAFTLAMTPFSFQFVNPDGTASTNQWVMTLYPPSQGVVVFGTNIIVGSGSITLTPNASGFGTNQCLPTQYRVFCASNGLGFLVNVLDTPTTAPLTTYANSVPVVFPNASPYGFLTNLLGFIPMQSNLVSVIGALGFQPATNNLGSITNLLGGTPALNTFGSITNALGYFPLTNSLSALTNAIGFQPATNTPAGIIAALQFTPVTNTYTALEGVAGFTFATNNPATNYFVTAVSGVTNGSGYLTNLVVTTNSINYTHQ